MSKFGLNESGTNRVVSQSLPVLCPIHAYTHLAYPLIVQEFLTYIRLFAQRFAAAVFSMDVDSLGLTCKILHTYDHALEMVALHVRIYDLIFFSLQFLEEYDCETVGEF